MESTLHRDLKAHYQARDGDRTEARDRRYRADVLRDDGTWVEIQLGPLGLLRAKLRNVLPDRPVHVVKPVVIERRIVRSQRADGPDLHVRRSPKRGTAVDIFDDLIGLARLFPHPNLRIDVVGLAIDEIRVPRRRWPGYRVADRTLRAVLWSESLHTPDDLWRLLPGDLPDPLTTREIGQALNRDDAFAQRVAYCLRLSGAVRTIGARQRRKLYERVAVAPY